MRAETEVPREGPDSDYTGKHHIIKQFMFKFTSNCKYEIITV